MPSPFLILALPRSRTFWLSRFLSYPPWSCGHEEARHLRSVADVRAWLQQDHTGSAETAVARWWRIIPQLCPEMRVVVIRRPVDEVVDSLMRLDLGFERSRLRPIIEKYDRALDRVERHLSPLSLRFADLENEADCGRVFERCLDLPHDHDWWARWAPQRVECDMRAILRHARAFAPQMALTGRSLMGQLRRRHSDHPHVIVPGDDGIDICRESPERVWADGGPLFAEHCLAVGEPEDEYQRKNLPLLWRLDAAGALHIITARCNGRLLAYLFSFLAESPEKVGLLTATQTLFFACNDAPPGLGLRLQRASIADLRARGVGEIYMRAGVRGAGPKLGVLYRRLGAQPHGEFFKLELKAA
jgi:hypothetical protein